MKLRYARGWRLPGGGRDPSEPSIDAALRELREEIGMTGHGDVALACEFEESVDFKRDLASLLVTNTISTIILEQRAQIGSMKAIGGTTRQVMRMYLVLAFLYGALGTLLGLVGGIAYEHVCRGQRCRVEGLAELEIQDNVYWILRREHRWVGAHQCRR